MSQDNDTIRRLTENLLQSPLFNLSLGSKELFHSDFLAWLCTEYRHPASALFNEFVPGESVCIKERGVLREKNHQDLRIEFEGGQALVIENKVKSIPNEGQLDEYSKRYANDPKTAFLLLSLVRPSFGSISGDTLELKSGRNWRYLDYASLAGRLANIVANTKGVAHYHGELLKDYVSFITNLDRLVKSCQVNMSDTNGNFFSFNNYLPSVAEARVHDVIQKIIYEDLAQAVSRALGKKQLIVKPLSSLADLSPGDLGVNTGYSNGTAMFSLYMTLEKIPPVYTPTNLLLQIQGNMFRLFFCFKDKEVVEHIADELVENGLWFNFEHLAGVPLIERKRKELHFNNYYGTDLYRYRTIGSVSPNELVNTIVRYAELMQKNRRDIERVVAQQVRT